MTAQHGEFGGAEAFAAQHPAQQRGVVGGGAQRRCPICQPTAQSGAGLVSTLQNGGRVAQRGRRPYLLRPLPVPRPLLGGRKLEVRGSFPVPGRKHARKWADVALTLQPQRPDGVRDGFFPQPEQQRVGGGVVARFNHEAGEGVQRHLLLRVFGASVGVGGDIQCLQRGRVCAAVQQDIERFPLRKRHLLIRPQRARRHCPRVGRQHHDFHGTGERHRLGGVVREQHLLRAVGGHAPHLKRHVAGLLANEGEDGRERVSRAARLSKRGEQGRGEGQQLLHGFYSISKKWKRLGETGKPPPAEGGGCLKVGRCA